MNPIQQNTQDFHHLFQKLSITADNQLSNIISINRSLQNYIKDKNNSTNLLGKLNALSNSYQIVLMDIGACLQQIKLGKLTELFFRIYYQLLSLVKWSFQKFLSFKEKQQILLANQDYQKMVENLNADKDVNQNKEYFRIKEACSFMANSIDGEIDKIKRQFSAEEAEYEEANMLKKRQKLDSIKPTDRELILIEAIEGVANQSEMFKMFVNSANTKFFEDYKAMNVVPFYKIKEELERYTSKKLKKANGHLSEILRKYIIEIVQKMAINQQKTYETVYVQTDKEQTEERLKRELRNKEFQLAQLRKQNNCNLGHIHNLQGLIKEKSSYFEKELLRMKWDMKGKEDIENLRKSVQDLVSARKIATQDNQSSRMEIVSENKDFRPFLNIQNNLQKIKRENRNNSKKKKIRFDREHYEGQSVNASKPISQKRMPSIVIPFDYPRPRKFTHQSKVFDILFYECLNSPCLSIKSNRRSCRSLKSRKKIGLEIESNVVSFGVDSWPRPKMRKESLITIKGVVPQQMRKPSKRYIRRGSHEIAEEGRQTLINLQQQWVKNDDDHKIVANRVSIRCIEGRKQRNTLISDDKTNPKLQNDVDSTNRILKKRYSNSNNTARSIKQLNSYNQKVTQTLRRNESKLNSRKIENIFEIINLDAENLRKKQLKLGNFRKNYQQTFDALISEKKPVKTEINFNANDISNVFLNEENAMEAQIMLGLQKSIVTGPMTVPCKQFYKELEPILLSWNQYRKKDFAKLKKFLRYPYSSIHHQSKSFDLQSITLATFHTLTQYIFALHSECTHTKKPSHCEHLQMFLKRLTTTKY